MTEWYKNLQERFTAFACHTQILNMVSDLHKAKNLVLINREDARQHCYGAVILLDYMIADPKWFLKIKELLRLREVIASFVVDDKPMADINLIIQTALTLDADAYKMLRPSIAKTVIEV
jgi:hypothetical protein